MATETWVKASGTWREANEVWVKASGVWRQAQEMWVKSSGTWRQVYEAMITLISVTATNISVAESDFDPSQTVEGTSTATIDPTNDGSVSYGWTKVSGNTITNVQGAGGEHTRKFSAFLGDGDSVSAVYRCTASNANGSVTDDFTINLSYTDLGS